MGKQKLVLSLGRNLTCDHSTCIGFSEFQFRKATLSSTAEAWKWNKDISFELMPHCVESHPSWLGQGDSWYVNHKSDLVPLNILFKSKHKSFTKGPCLSFRVGLLVEFPIKVLAKTNFGFFKVKQGLLWGHLSAKPFHVFKTSFSEHTFSLIHTQLFTSNIF